MIGSRFQVQLHTLHPSIYLIVDFRHHVNCKSLGPPLRYNDHRAGLTMLQIFQLKWAYPQSMIFRGLPWDWFVFFY